MVSCNVGINEEHYIPHVVLLSCWKHCLIFACIEVSLDVQVLQSFSLS